MIRKMAAKGEETFIAAVIYGLWAFNGFLYAPADFSGREEFVSYCMTIGRKRKNGFSILLSRNKVKQTVHFLI